MGRRVTCLVLLIAASAGRADGLGAQERGHILPITHPTTPFVEYLVARGELRGLPAFERPLDRRQLRTTLDAGSASRSPASAELAAWLRSTLGDAPGEGEWAGSFHLRAGAQAGTQARRQLMLEGGEGGLWGLARGGFGGEFGPFSLQVVGGQESRLRWDPDSPRTEDPGAGAGALRLDAALLRGAWRWLTVEWGELERNWGPAGVPGLMISPLGYHRPELGFSLGPDALQFQWRTAALSGGTDEATGDPVSRFWTMHRLRWTPSPDLELSVWETSMVARLADADATRISPLQIFNFGRQFGIGDRRNASIGFDAMWRPGRRVLLEGQLLVDDLIVWNRGSNPYSSRVGFTLQARGPAGDRWAWRAYATGLSARALNTFRPEEAYLDDGRGMGRIRPDHFEGGAEFTRLLGVAGPAGSSGAGGRGRASRADADPEAGRPGWGGLALARAGIRWRRQGPVLFTDPFPDLVRAPSTPTLPTWSPDIEQETWALVGGLDWMAGPLTLQGEVHLQRRSFPVTGDPSEWAGVALVQLHWELGVWGFGGMQPGR